jgi:hypothetical protein
MSIREPVRVFVGYDSRERGAYEVCVASMRRHSSIPLLIEPLDERRLRHADLYRREWRVEDGQFIDMRDRTPFSTEFSFTRFLVPALCQWRGVALFCDCDFLWRSDIAELFALADSKYSEFAVQVVKHDHRPNETVKMDGRTQSRYYRKNWSSLIVWNCASPAHLMLTPHKVNSARGQWLHAFSWLDDSEIGGLDESFNWLEGTSSMSIDPKAIHFTRGGPWLPGWQDVSFGDAWRAEADRAGIMVAFS